MYGIGQDALPEVQEWSNNPPGCPGMVGRPSRISLSSGTPFRMSGSGREACRMSVRPTRMCGSGRVALSDIWEWLGGCPGCPRVVVTHSRMSGSGGRHLRIAGSGREALLVVQEWLGGSPECPGLVEKPSCMSGRPSWMSASGREALLYAGSDRKALPDVLEW